MEMEQDLDALADYEASTGYMKYLEHVVIDSQPLKKPFREIGEQWQWEREARCANAIDNLGGFIEEYNGPRSFWTGQHKGCDKTHAIARKLCFLLGWSKKRLHLYAMAGDKDQAKLITLAMKDVLADNPWIAKRVKVSDYNASGESGSYLEVMPMDAATGQGIFPDYVIAEEVSHWKHEEGRNFWNFIVSSVNKRPSCVFEVCTNAGHIGSWQWKVRNEIKDSKFWSFFEAAEGIAPATWMSEEKIAEDSKLMDPGEVARLYRNRWIDPGEERGYLTYAEASRCEDETLRERTKGDRGVQYWLVVDYGGVNDRCALTVMHGVHNEDKVVVDRLDCWQGTHADPVKIDKPSDEEAAKGISFRSVEEWLDISLLHFPGATLVFDPYQMESLAQKYQRRGRRVVRFEYRGGKANYEMAQILKNYVQNRKIRWSKDAGLLPGAEDDTLSKELSRLVKKPMSYGYRFDHEAGRHDDRATAVGSGLVMIVPEMPGGGGVTVVKPEQTAENGMMPRGIPLVHKDWAQSRNLFGMGKK